MVSGGSAERGGQIIVWEKNDSDKKWIITLGKRFGSKVNTNEH